MRTLDPVSVLRRFLVTEVAEESGTAENDFGGVERTASSCGRGSVSAGFVICAMRSLVSSRTRKLRSCLDARMPLPWVLLLENWLDVDQVA